MDVDDAVPAAGSSRTPVSQAMNGHDDILEEATNLESKFYREGYESGHSHGKLHGLFEGRALGQEKGFEVWEELGFYEGFAQVCVDQLGIVGGSAIEAEAGQTGRKSKEARAIANAEALLALIGSFPTSNPTPANAATPIDPADASTTLNEEPDLAGLMAAIRAKYRLLCTSVGARPRLQTAPSTSTKGDGLPTEGVEGPLKGVDYSALRY